MGRQADCSRSDISENKSDLPPLTKWPSVKRKGTSKPSMHGKLGNIPAARPDFGKKQPCAQIPQEEPKKFLALQHFFKFFCLTTEKHML